MIKQFIILVHILISLAFSYINAQSIPNNFPTENNSTHFNQFNNSTLPINKFQMNHEFSLSTSILNGQNTSSGIYSNISSYNFSEQLKLNSRFQLIQTQYKYLPYSNFKPQLSYDFELEYQLNSNTHISLRLANYNSSTNNFRNYSLFNAPK